MTRRKKHFYEWFNLLTITWIVISDICLNAFCLKDLKIFVPDAVIMGNAATLSCHYDLEQAALYSVRWYFESEEFYRYVPKETPPARVFMISGMNVDLTSSDATSVTLRSVTRDLTGSFQCEVSEDAPLFHTDIRSAHMQVIELPKNDPIMQIDKKVISTAETFKAVCTVGTSFPPANITWFINGRRVYKTPFQRIVYRTYEGTATFSSLEMYPHSLILQDLVQTVSNKFQTNIILLCEVSILHVYHKSVQQRIPIVMASMTTVSPNLLGLEGSKRNGDPDNSALTGSSRGLSSFHSYRKYIFINMFYILIKIATSKATIL